jgi:hypothetical protein
VIVLVAGMTVIAPESASRELFDSFDSAMRFAGSAMAPKYMVPTARLAGIATVGVQFALAPAASDAKEHAKPESSELVETVAVGEK